MHNDTEVTFEDVRLHKDAAVQMFLDQRQMLLSYVPDAEVMHVGSTSLTEGLSRGDVDIQIRVPAERYAGALAAIAPHYVVNPDGLTCDDAASFKDDDLDPPVGLILTAVDGSGDFLWRFRDTLLARPDLAREYSDLKARFQNGSLADYRADKHMFIRRVVRTPQYVELGRSLPWRHRPLRLETGRLLVFDVQDGDAPRLARFHAHCLEFLAPWTTARPDGWTSEPFWQGRLLDLQAEKRAACGAHFIWLQQDDLQGELAGVASLHNVNAGPATRACDLTFCADGEHQGEGLAREALEAVLQFAFEEMGLHRVKATHAPADLHRARLLRQLGFVVEGYARDCLRVDNTWQDQVLCALINPADL